MASPTNLTSSQMFTEAMEASACLREQLAHDEPLYRALGARLRELNPKFVATIARGSSDHAASYASYLIPLLSGRVVASISPSIVTVLHSRLRLDKQFVLALSQSGGSPDLLDVFENAKASGAFTVAIVNNENSLLAKAAQVLLPQKAGEEKSVAATKTVLLTMSAIARLAAEWVEDAKLLSALKELPERLEIAAKYGMAFDDSLLLGVTDAFIISRALGECGAREIALKLKETCGIHAEGFSSAEVRHGPREIVNGKFLVIVLALKGCGEKEILSTASDLNKQGAKVLVVAPPSVLSLMSSFPFDTFVKKFEIPEANDFRLSPLICLQALFPWIARSAAALGRNPDEPLHLKSKIVRTL